MEIARSFEKMMKQASKPASHHIKLRVTFIRLFVTVPAKLNKMRLAGRRIGESPLRRGTEPLSCFRFATCTEG